jgi:hypothetical protein
MFVTDMRSYGLARTSPAARGRAEPSDMVGEVVYMPEHSAREGKVRVF